MLSIAEGSQGLRKEAERTPWNPIICGDDDRRAKREREAGRARYASTHKLLLNLSEKNDGQVWVARTRAAMGVWLDQLTAML